MQILEALFIRIFNFVKILLKFFKLNKVIYCFVYSKPFINEFISSLKYDGIENRKKNDKYSLTSLMIKQCHVLEKGLAMPNTRAGFGEVIVVKLFNNLNLFLSKYKIDEMSFMCFNVLKTYCKYNENLGHNIDLITKTLTDLEIKYNITKSGNSDYGYRLINRDYIIKLQNSNFAEFVTSRHSVRNFVAKPVSPEVINEAIKISLAAPSACNRQSWHVHHYNGKTCSDLLKIQNGNRGFGHLISTILVVSSDRRSYSGSNELNLPYVDGGLFAMTLIYSLHYLGLGTCCLNLCLNCNDRKKFIKTANIKKNETLIMMIAVGYMPEKFKITDSRKKVFSDIITHH